MCSMCAMCAIRCLYLRLAGCGRQRVRWDPRFTVPSLRRSRLGDVNRPSTEACSEMAHLPQRAALHAALSAGSVAARPVMGY